MQKMKKKLKGKTDFNYFNNFFMVYYFSESSMFYKFYSTVVR